MTNEPINLSEKDLLERPPGGGKALTPGKGNFLGEIKTGAKQIKEIVDVFKSLGLKLPGRLGALVQMGDDKPQDDQGGDSPVGQAKAFLQILIIKYGDITVNELIDKLRADIGNKKLSNLGGK